MYTPVKWLTDAGISKDFGVSYNADWIYVMNEKHELPESGWKLHVSCTPDEFSKLASSVFPFLLERKLSFKFPVGRHKLISLIAGGAGYLECGKILTIYPENQGTGYITRLVEDLNVITRGFTKYPVLTDFNLTDSPVSLRYGAIVPKNEAFDEEGTRLAMMTSPNGRLVPDLRQENRYKPSWAKALPFIKDKDYDAERKINVNIKNLKLLSKKSKGSVFSGIYQGSTCIMKIAIKDTVKDSRNRDAITRLKNEAHMAAFLQSTKLVPETYRYQQSNGYSILVQEKLRGIQLENIYSSRLGRLLKDYRNIRVLVKNLLMSFKIIHDTGVAFGDVSAANVLVNDDLSVQFIDLETCHKITAKSPISGFTPGFTPTLTVHNVRITDDIYAEGALIFLICTSFVPAFVEQASHFDSRSLIMRLKSLAELVCDTQTKTIADFGIDLMDGKILSDEDIIFKFEKFMTKRHASDYQLKVNHMNFQTFTEYENGYLQMLNLALKNPKFSFGINTNKTLSAGLDEGYGSLFALEICQYELTKSKSVLLTLRSYVNDFCNEYANYDLSLVGLANGVCVVFYTIIRLRSLGKSNRKINEMYDRILKMYESTDFGGLYSGVQFGLSGIGVAICAGYQFEPEVKYQMRLKQLLDIIHSVIVRRITYRKDRLFINEVFDGEEEQETFDFAYGATGIGYFMCIYHKLFRDKTDEKLLRKIFYSVVDGSIHEEANDLTFSPISGSYRYFDSVVNGLAGMVLFANAYDDECPDDGDAKQLSKKMLSSLHKVKNYHDAGLSQGVSGILLAELSSSNIDWCFVNHCINVIFNLADSKKSFPMWEQTGRITQPNFSFFNGSSGVYFTLFQCLIKMSKLNC